jgi:hypothetical protein
MSNPYLSPKVPQGYRTPAPHYLPPTPAEEYRPGSKKSKQLTTILVIAVLVAILAALAMVLRDSLEVFGAILLPSICLVLIGVMELFRLLFPPRGSQFYLPPPPPNPLQTANLGDGQNPFASGANLFGGGLGTTPFSQPPTSSPPSPPAD